MWTCPLKEVLGKKGWHVRLRTVPGGQPGTVSPQRTEPPCIQAKVPRCGRRALPRGSLAHPGNSTAPPTRLSGFQFVLILLDARLHTSQNWASSASDVQHRTWHPAGTGQVLGAPWCCSCWQRCPLPRAGPSSRSLLPSTGASLSHTIDSSPWSHPDSRKPTLAEPPTLRQCSHSTSPGVTCPLPDVT